MKELRLNLPTTCIELSNRQLKAIAKLKLQCTSEMQFLSLALLCLSGLKVVRTGEHFAYEESQVHYYRHKIMRKPFVIDSFVFQELAEKVKFLLNDDECKPLQHIGFSLPCNYRMYLTTFERYLMAENYFQAYSTTKLPEHLNCLVSVLYHLPFQKFNSNKIKKRARRFAKTPMHVKFTAYMWYAGFRKYVSTECPTLFKPANGGQPVKIREQINSMKRMLNKGYITENPGLLKANVWDALYEMEAMAKEVESMRKAAKS